ncbi:hypothetical protein CASFOL_030522 [Castilleja foliolosa]|uniref:Uncharacterized protein n=1 Tax=Castilleja foliolosa TaxID=1961234 RepID=A0ABD3C825_9LAMI
MTGGTSGGIEARSHKWDDKKIEEMQLKESEAFGKISGLENEIQYAEIEKNETEMNARKYLLVVKNFEQPAKPAHGVVDLLQKQLNLHVELYGVSGYPTLKFFPKNEAGADYDGGRDLEDFVTFINEKCGTSRDANGQPNSKAAIVEGLDNIVKEFGLISLRSERDKLALEVQIAQEKLARFMKELDHQREEQHRVIARNVEFSQLIVDYQKKLRESVSILKHEKEILQNSKMRASNEVRILSERVHREGSPDAVWTLYRVLRKCERRPELFRGENKKTISTNLRENRLRQKSSFRKSEMLFGILPSSEKNNTQGEEDYRPTID